MKNRLFGLALSTLFGLGVALAAPQAQDQPGSQGHYAGRQAPDPDRQVRMYAKRLNLTSDQQAQLLPILTARQQQVESIRSDSSLSGQDRRAKMQAVRQDTDAKIRALLNDSQKQAFDQMQQQMREHNRERRDRSQNGQNSSN
jgi:Spy/CpxP family protein refolding chaperone